MAVLKVESPENNPKNTKNNNQLKTKRIPKPKYKLRPAFTFSLPCGLFAPPPRQLRHWL